MGISSMLWAGFGDMLLNLFACIPKLMYLLATSFLSILDVLQLLVRKLAGLDSYYIDGELQSGDIVEDLITGIVTNRYPALNNVFWSFIILGVIILFVTTIIALIRNEYTPEKDGSNSKSKVMGRTFKAVLTFCIVPIATMFGVYLCNVVLQAMDSVSSGQTAASIALDTDLLRHETINVGGREVEAWSCYNLFGTRIYTTTTPFSGLVFKVGAYNANRVRTTQGTDLEYSGSGTITGTRDFYALLQMTTDGATNMGGLFTGGANDHEEVATKIDEAFANNVVLLTPQVVNYPDGYIASHNLVSFDLITGAQTLWLQSGKSVDSLNRFNTALVWYYYDLWNFNIILAFGAGIIMIAIFINIIFGLMRRIIECVALFLISPSLAAIMPLDDGNAFKKWFSKFVGKILSAYGAVIGLNLIMIILPYITTINFFNIPLVDTIIDTLFVIVGLVIVKSFMKMLSELIGADDAQSMGDDIAKQVGQNSAKALKLTGAAVGATAGILGATALPITRGVVAGVRAKRAADQARDSYNATSPAADIDEQISVVDNQIAAARSKRLSKDTMDTLQARKKELEKQKQKRIDDYNIKHHGLLEYRRRRGELVDEPQPQPDDGGGAVPPQGSGGTGGQGGAGGSGGAAAAPARPSAPRSVPPAFDPREGRRIWWRTFGQNLGGSFVRNANRAINPLRSFVGYAAEPFKETDAYKAANEVLTVERFTSTLRGISAREQARYEKEMAEYKRQELERKIRGMLDSNPPQRPRL